MHGAVPEPSEIFNEEDNTGKSEGMESCGDGASPTNGPWKRVVETGGCAMSETPKEAGASTQIDENA